MSSARPGSLAAESLILSLGNSICDFVGAAAALPHQPSSPAAHCSRGEHECRDVTSHSQWSHITSQTRSPGQGREGLVQLFNVQELPYVVRVKRSPIICSLCMLIVRTISGIARCCVSARRAGSTGCLGRPGAVLCGCSTYGRDRESGDQTGGDNTRPHTARALTHMFGFYVELLNQNIISSYQSYQL